MGTTVIGLIVIAVIVFYLVFIYNRLVSLRNQFKNGFAQIDVQLQRRHDLIPNLVEAAKAYLTHEKSTLTTTTASQAAAMACTTFATAVPAATVAALVAVTVYSLLATLDATRADQCE